MSDEPKHARLVVSNDEPQEPADPCWEHEPQTIDGVTTCARCGASEEEIVAEQEARLEAAIALGVEPELDYGIDDGPDSDDVCADCGELGSFCDCLCRGCDRPHDECVCDDYGPLSNDPDSNADEDDGEEDC